MPVHLVWAHLRAHKLRTLLTVGSIAVAVFLLCFLRTVVVTLRAGVEASAETRLVTQSAVSLFVDLPMAYQSKIETIEGVQQTIKQQWFGGYYQDPSNFFAQFAVDAEKLFTSFPEIELIEGDPAAFAARPTNCLIGKQIAERYGWQVGSKIPIIGTIFPRADGKPWDFEVVGIYRSKASNVDEATLWFHFDYLYEAMRAGDVAGFGDKDMGVGVYSITLADGADPVQVASRIDALFENGPQRVQTTSEAEFQRQFVTMLGSIPVFLSWIGGAVLFAILLAAINTMLMSSRQRTHEFGILKALGFDDGVVFRLLMAESLLVCGLGGVLGVGLAIAGQAQMAEAMAAMFPQFLFTHRTLGMGFGLALAVGAVAGLVPAVRASRLDPVEALRAEV